MHYGHVSFDVCPTTPELTEWNSVTGANWRIATSAGPELLAEALPDLDPEGATEVVPCVFTE
jgi:predicted secreted protein